MNTKHKILIAALSAALYSGVSGAGMLNPDTGDLVATAVAKAAIAPEPIVENPELHYAWRSSETSTEQSPFEAVSQEYWADYSADQLSAGIDIHTTAPGAVVRISPLQGTRHAVQPADLQVQRNGQLYANASGISSVASAEDIAAGLPAFPDNTSAFRLRAELGSGAFRLSAPVSDGRYLIHVYEPDSDQQLKLSAAADSHLSGQNLSLRASFESGGRVSAVDNINGVLTAPDGRSFELDYTLQRDGSYAANLPAPAAAASDGPIPWEVHTFSSSGEVLRDAKTAISITAPVARLSGAAHQLSLRAYGTNVVVQFGIDSGVSGRFQLTGTLWGTNEKGALVPVAVAQTAKDLSGVEGDYLELRFLTDVVDPAKVRAPFEIRDLRLQNQADMGLLERRARAWVSD